MTQVSPVDVIDWRHMMEVVADRFENDVYRIVGCVATAAAEVQATAARLPDREMAAAPDHVRATAAATGQVSDGLHGIALSAADLRHSVDAVVREMIAASKLARGNAVSTPDSAEDINQLVQAVLLTREIDTMVTDIAGLTNLLAMNLTIEAVSTRSDLAATSFKVRSLSTRAVRTIEEIAGQIAEIQRCVAATVAAFATPCRRPGDTGLRSVGQAA